MSAHAHGDDGRRDALRLDGRLNGIDYVEVESNASGDPVLHVYLLGRLPDEPQQWLDADNLSIVGGTVQPQPTVLRVGFHDARDDERDDRITATLDRAGDASTYTLELRGTEEHPLADLDPHSASASFSFVLTGSATDVDCAATVPCSSDATPTPSIDYLAKDYASFRRLLLDRLATTLPDWRERHGADLYVTVLEALAYRADHLSYAQDAVATEAYLETARFRTSVRRHARLVDYRMHEGCNARTWVAVEVDGDPTVRADRVQFVTRPEGADRGATVLLESDVAASARSSYEVFEPVMERGWEEVVPADVVDPHGLTARLLRGGDPRLRALREQLDLTTRALFESALAGERDELASILVGFLSAALDGPLLDDLDRSDASGRGHNLVGLARRRRNRCAMQEIFPEELVQPARLRFHEAHNVVRFHTWHGSERCLPAGSTEAVLRDGWTDEGRGGRVLDSLGVRDVLVLEELMNPETGSTSDVDPTHRHPVRIVSLVREVDPLGDTPVVRVRWSDDDALPFPLVLSAIGPAPECRSLADVSVARGNIVLVDHGETVRQAAPPELLDGAREILTVPFDPPDDVVPSGGIEWCCADAGWLDESPVRADRYSPRLARTPVAFAEPLSAEPRSARAALQQDPRRARPQVALFSPVERTLPWMDVVTREAGEGVDALYERWSPRFDLLSSDGDDRHFVVEVDDGGVARVRFGDGVCAAAPSPGARFLAWYRVGGGASGNVGRDAIRCLLLRGSIEGGAVRGVRNPLPALGGKAPERVADVRLRAPHEFRTTLKRAVLADDYAAIALRELPERLQRAAARLSSTGDNRTLVSLFIDPRGSTDDDAELWAAVTRALRPFVRIGHRLDVVSAEYVPIDLTLRIRVAPHHQWGAVLARLRSRFGAATAFDGAPGIFHPDRLTFGQAISVSALLTDAVDVPGVERAAVVSLTRHAAAPDVPATEVFEVEPWQIVRLDDDPNRPANGVLRFEREVAV